MTYFYVIAAVKLPTRVATHQFAIATPGYYPSLPDIRSAVSRSVRDAHGRPVLANSDISTEVIEISLSEFAVLPNEQKFDLVIDTLKPRPEPKRRAALVSA